MNPVPWLQMTNMISYQGLVRTFPNTFLFEMMKSKSKDVTLAAIYALGEGRCQAENITRELHRLSQSDDMEIKIAAIKALGRIYR